VEQEVQQDLVMFPELQVVLQFFQQSRQLVVAEVEHLMLRDLVEDLVVEVVVQQVEDHLEDQEIRPL
tara:strand:- start:178 stop:378 length:201 start_codon:yes stop_codon:yes gene_type:complete